MYGFMSNVQKVMSLVVGLRKCASPYSLIFHNKSVEDFHMKLFPTFLKYSSNASVMFSYASLHMVDVDFYNNIKIL